MLKRIKKPFYFIIGLFLLLILVDFLKPSAVRDLKKEVYSCTGEGGTGKIVQASFSINPSTKTLTFSQDGGLMGSILKYPSKIEYSIKSASGDKILTYTHTYITTTKFGKTLTLSLIHI